MSWKGLGPQFRAQDTDGHATSAPFVPSFCRELRVPVGQAMADNRPMRADGIACEPPESMIICLIFRREEG